MEESLEAPDTRLALRIYLKNMEIEIKARLKDKDGVMAKLREQGYDILMLEKGGI